MFWSLPKLSQFLLPPCWQVRATLSILLTDVSKMYDDDQETISLKTNIDSIISHICSLVCSNVIIWMCDFQQGRIPLLFWSNSSPDFHFLFWKVSADHIYVLTVMHGRAAEGIHSFQTTPFEALPLNAGQRLKIILLNQ